VSPATRGFGSFEDGQAHCVRLFPWYNDDLRHSGIGLHTLANVHCGRDEANREQRGVVLLDGVQAPRAIRSQDPDPAGPRSSRRS